MGSIVSAAFTRLYVRETQPRCCTKQEFIHFQGSVIFPGVSIHYLCTLLLMNIQLLSSL